MSMRTGEQGDAQFYNRKRVDRQVFMRDYSSVVDRKLGLSRTAKNVKSAIAEVYQETVSASGKRLAMSADLVHLHFFDGGISGLDVGMSERTFRRGLKELLEKRVIAPYQPNSNLFWINPTVFFMGNRVRWVEEWEAIEENERQPEDSTTEDQQELNL